ncbi:ubiquitin recognition factor in ER-associated degradation protein 1-like isoform X1 [Vigna umbellata]|uniref:ubiquitin recognition factor in ER-associated degradation protein 1-like isoform X1 n=1 Tax=Vigna umbellata TaxID=87088 RepID=UPI001F5F5CB2|nr:ubiquitin recognition factor in ER-associated degradation protein 1-like isoform X1 [Vigna umbellata]XP_047153687.1 ubiquitin recognition factor in ER-associated degradation protein 1-like isoform X1 [Vigna umbellata]
MAYYGNDRCGTFEQYYRCYPVSFIDKSHLEKGDKIIMPPSALDRLASLHIEYPMLFQLINPSAERVTHCGVLEFVADEGIIYIPYWMMENMLLQEGDLLYVKNTNLTKATYVKLQPHTKDFLDIYNPKAILETSLRSYSCLTTGDTIMVQYNKKKYYIDVVGTRPSPAVSIIETDCEVDFAPPLDYKEPKKQAKVDRRRPKVEDEPPKKIARFNSFSGFSRRLDGKASLEPVEQTSLPELKQKQYHKEINNSDAKPTNTASHGALGKLVFESNATTSSNKATPKVSQESQCQDKSQEEGDPKFKPFIPFSGSGRRLGGKTSAHPVEVASFPELHQKETDKEMKDSDSKPVNIASRMASGKLVCGINAASSSCQATSKTSHENKWQEKFLEEEDPKYNPFIPFSGMGRRLGGKSSTRTVEETSRPKLKHKETDKEMKNSDSKPTNTASCRSSGNLVFGSNVTTSSFQATPKFNPGNKSQEKSQKEEQLKFKPFTGKKHTLMD